MKNKEAVDLRQKAEELLSKKTSKTDAQISEHEMLKLVHELEVHQIELELQNEELMLARAEEKKTSEKYVDLYEFAPSGYFLLSSEGSIIELNLAGASLLGKERSYLKNKPFALFIAQESKSTFSQFFENVLKSNKMLACDAALSVSNESALYTHITGIATENKEQILLTLVDITKRVEAEHELSKSRDLLQSIIENAPIRVFWKDDKLKYLGCNNAFAQDAGMPGPEDMVGKDDFQMGWKEQAELYRADDQLVIDSGEPRIGYEEPQTTPDGQTIWLRTSKVPLRDANRKVIGILGVYEDITELKQAQSSLISTSAKQAAMIENIGDVIGIIGVDRSIKYQSPNIEKWFGWKPEEVIGKNGWDFIHPEDIERTEKEYIKLLEKETASVVEYRFRCKDGNYKWVELTAINRINDPTINGTLVNFTDITERKQAEKEVNFQANLLKAVDQSVIVTKPDGQVIYWNPYAEKLFGWDATQAIGKNINELTIPQISAQQGAEIMEMLNAGQSWSGEFITQRHDGTTFPIYITNTPVIDEKGELNAIIGISIDITARKQAEEALQESEEKYRSIFENSALGIFRSTSEGRYEEVNKAFAKILGFNSAKNIVDEVKDITALYKSPKDREKIIKEFAEKGFVEDYEVLANHPQKEQVWISINAKQQKHPDGTVYYEGTVKDITARKLAEESLRASEEMMRTSQSVAHICSYSTTLNVNKIGKSEWVCSPEFYNIFGIDETYPHTIEGWANFIHPDHRKEVFDYHESVVKEKKSYDREYKIIRINDGAERWVHGTGELEFDEKGTPIRMHGAIQDITLQKKAEETLIKSKNTLNSALQSMTDAVFISDTNGNFIEFNEVFASFHRLNDKKEAFEKLKNWQNIIEVYNLDGSVLPHDKWVVNRAIKGETGSGEEYILEKKDTGEKWYGSYNYAPIRDDKGMIIGSVVVARDVTARVEAEKELKGIEWLLQPKEKTTLPGSPEYGDLTELNTERTILDAVGKEVLNGIVSDYLALLETSAAVYEKNGDYAFGIFSSDWCQFMDCASRDLCKSKDNKKALESGEWLCHESCWKDAALTSMQTNQPTDIECSGGLRMYAIPITANDEIVGAINFGYGNPPTDEKKLKEIATNYKVSVDKLREIAQNYETRPAFIIDIAKEKLESSAMLIGNMVERKFAEDKLSISEERLKIILDTSPFPTAVTDLKDEIIQYWSKSAVKLFGHHPKTVSEWYELAYPDPDYRKEVVARWKPFLEKSQDLEEAINTGEYQITCKDGSVKTCELFAQYIPGNLIVTFNDITEKKQAVNRLRESEERYRTLMENISAGIGYYDLEGNVILYNKLAASNMNGTPEDFIGKSIFEIFGEKFGKFYFDRILSAAEATQFLEFEDEVTFPDKTLWLISRYNKISNADGAVIGVQIVSHDITNLKIAEISIKESEERFKILHNATFGGIAIHDNGLLLDCNQGLSETTGYKGNELIGMDVLQLFAEESRELVKGKILAEYEEAYEAIGMRKNGEKYPVRIAAKMIPYKGEKVRVAEFRDITEQKKAIEKLKKSEELHRLLTENSVDMIWQMDLRLNFTYISPNSIDVLGYTQMELMGTNLSGYATRKEFFKMARQALNSLKNYKTFRHVIFEANLIKKNGEEIPVEIIGRILLNKSGLPVALQGSTRDITERKQIQDELRINFERYQKAQSIGHVGNWEYNIATNEIWASDEAKRIYGFDVNRNLIDLEEVERCIPKRKEVNQALVNLIEHNKEYDIEFEIITADKGLSKYIRSTAVTEKDEKGIPIRVLGIIHDITERKNAEKELNKIHNRFNLAINATNDGLFDWNLVTNEIYYSPAWKRMLGYRDDELPNDFSIWENLTEPEDAERSWKMQQELINKQRSKFEMEFKMKHKDGHWVDILSRATAYFDENDKATRIVGTHVDISERKKAAEEIYRLKKAVDDSFFGVVMATLDGTNIYSNHAAYKLFGYDPKKDNMDGSPSGIGWADQEKFNEAMQKLKSNGSGEAEFVGIRKDGSFFDCYVSATLISNLRGEKKHIIAYYMDVTEKKKSEKHIKELNEQLEQKVLDRTKELEDRNKQLARMNKLFVGRELRMKELKQMIKELEEKLEDK